MKDTKRLLDKFKQSNQSPRLLRNYQKYENTQPVEWKPGEAVEFRKGEAF